MRIPRIENIDSFWSLVISLPHFGSQRITAQGYLVRLDQFSATQQFEGTFFLQDQNSIRMQCRLCHSHRAQQPSSKYPDSHARIIDSRWPSNATLMK